MGDKLREFLKKQYGPGKRWKNITTFSFAVGNNAELIPHLERSGTGGVKSLRKVAKVTGEPLLSLMIMADVVTPEEVLVPEKRQLTNKEWEVVEGYRSMSPEVRETAIKLWQVLREHVRPPH